MDKRVWITWEIQRRNRSLSKEVDAKLFEVTSPYGRFRSYPYKLMKTWRILKEEQPVVLFVQNPSIVLAFSSLLFKKILSIKLLVVDAHNAGIYPLEGRYWILNRIAKYIIRNTDVIIITNKSLFHYVTSIGGNPVEVPDPLPVLQRTGVQKNNDACKKKKLKATFICTWADDEPYEELIQAASKYGDSIEFYITGKFQGKFIETNLPENIILTGFVEDKEFVNLLSSSDFIIVLTKREDCLNCGAYEAVSLGRPLILSDTFVLRDYFSMGAVFSGNDARSLQAALEEMSKLLPIKANEVCQLKALLEVNWHGYKDTLEHMLISEVKNTKK